MQQHKTRPLALVWIAAGSLLGLACGTTDDPSPSADSTGGGSGTTQSQSTDVSASGNMPTVTEGVDTTAGSMTGGSFLDPSTGSDAGPMPLPNGSPCTGPGDCETEFCYTIPMIGGVCSECLMDSDCGMGTCSVDFMMGYAVCTDGGIGVMCNSDKGCMDDLVCAEVIDTGGLFPLDFCSECNAETPCADPQICSPVLDVANIQGFLGCVDPMSVPNGGGCPLDGAVGDGAVCMSGICGTAIAFGLVPIGLCGECLTDMDCPGGTCQAGVADQAGVVGSTCI